MREGEDLFTDSVVVLDAMTGAYKRHFKLVPRDWHDWDVASAPALIHTRGGEETTSVTPKDGHLYGIDLADNAVVYRTPVTKIENVEAPFATDKAVRFCPGCIRRVRVERPSLRSGRKPHHHRRGGLVHDGDTTDRRTDSGRANRRSLVRQRDRATRSTCSAGKIRILWAAGSTLSTPTPASGNGG